MIPEMKERTLTLISTPSTTSDEPPTQPPTKHHAQRSRAVRNYVDISRERKTPSEPIVRMRRRRRRAQSGCRDYRADARHHVAPHRSGMGCVAVECALARDCVLRDIANARARIDKRRYTSVYMPPAPAYLRKRAADVISFAYAANAHSYRLTPTENAINAFQISGLRIIFQY